MIIVKGRKFKLTAIILLIPAIIAVYAFVFILWQGIKELPRLLQHSEAQEITAIEEAQSSFDMPIPQEYIPIYMEAATKYHIPWPLLAAHHRIETRFSTMQVLESHVGAEGHMQFMPCTFVGWDHPTCSGLGQGEISVAEKTSLSAIAKYGGYGVDGDGDGIADPYNIKDAVYSAANYLSRFGAADGDLKRAIFEYNHSDEYVANVLHFYEQYSAKREILEQAAQPNEDIE